MKEQSSKKQRKWLLPAILLVALLAVAGVILAVIGQGGSKSASADPEPAGSTEMAVYWNVEREKYVSSGANGYSARSPRSDGYYYIRFALGGEQLDLPVADAVLATKIDMQKAMGLVFDENGVVIDMVPIHTYTGGALAETLYVDSVDGNTVMANNSITNEGVWFTITLNENTQIYNGSSDTALAGMACGISEGDAIYAIRDLDGSIGWVFVDPYVPPGDIYWNIYRKYDSTAKTTTRERDELGYYTFEMAFNGGVVTLQTRDVEVATKVDSYAAKCMGLEFDEDGLITGAVGTSSRGTNGVFGSWTRVMEINGRDITSVKLSDGSGTIHEGTLAKECKIIDVSPNGGYSGAYLDITELRYGDMVHGLLDKRGQIYYLYVIERLGEYDLYWNVERKYDSTTKQTKRTPAADGYYYIQVATGGKQLTVRTKDREMATKLDSYAARCFGMELDGDEIVKFYGASSVHGGGVFGSWYYVDQINGKEVTVKRILSGDTTPTYVTGTLADDVEIINGSTNYVNYCGEYTTLQVGDRVHGLTDLEGNIRVLFVVERPITVPIYWNVNRMYDSTAEASTRKRAEDGYFYFLFAVNGKQVTLKTKDQELCNKIDSSSAKCMGLQTNGDIITKYVAPSSVNGYTGGTKSLSWVDVISINGSSFTAQKNQAGHADDGKIFSSTMGYGCKIYNVSTGYKKFCGEETTLRVGDRIHVLHDADGYAKIIFVVGGRVKELDTDKDACPCAEGVTWEPWDGTTEFEDGKYYYLTQDVTAPQEGFYLENIKVSLRLDGHTISSEGRCFYLQTGAQLSICDHTTRGKLVGCGVEGESGGVIRMYTAGNSAYCKLFNIDVVRVTDENVMPKEGGAISASGPVYLENVNVTGGAVSARGGAILVNPSGSLRMFGGSLKDGKSSSGGGNMYINGGTAYLEDVTVSGGTGSTKGSQIYMNTTNDVRFNNVTVSDTYGIPMSIYAGTLQVEGVVNISRLDLGSEANLKDLGLDTSSSIAVSGGEQVIMTDVTKDKSSVFTPVEADEFEIVYDASAKTISLHSTVVPKPHTGDHCLCNGEKTGDHTSCTTLTGWIKITDDVFEKAVGTNDSVQGIKFIKDGNYYLESNYKLSGTLCIMPGQNINICLNGNKLSSGSRLGMVAGTLNITDCRGGGRVVGGGTSNGVTLKLLAGGAVNLYGGTLTSDGTVGTDGGVVVISTDKGNIAPADCTTASFFTMYGGAVTGGQAKNGGNILIYHAECGFIMYDGTVSNGTAERGGNLDVGNSQSVVKLLGGTITGGTADNVGGARIIADLTVGGDMNITGNTGGDLYLGSGKLLDVSALSSNARIGITMASPGVFAENVETDLSACFYCSTDSYKTVYSAANKTLSLVYDAPAQHHCACGGHGAGAANHTCDETMEWTAWASKTSLPTTSGNYYLIYDVNLSSRTNIGTKDKDANVAICLNGKTITSPSDNGAFSVHGTLTITDCQGTGKVTSACTRPEGGLIYISNNGQAAPCLNLYAGTLESTGSVTNYGGLIVMGNSGTQDVTVNIYGGTLTGGSAGLNGGAIYMNTRTTHTQTLNIYGGTITGCEVTGDGGIGGAIGIKDATTAAYANINIYGGSITGNTAALGGDIHAYVAPVVSGDVKIGNLYLCAGQKLDVSNLTSGASIGITMASPGVFAENVETDLSGLFSCTGDYYIEYSAADKTLSLVFDAPAQHHCVCGGHGAGAADHTCDESVEWTAWASTTSLPTTSGNYYLVNDVVLSERANIGTKNADANVAICLNGKTITSPSNNGAFSVHGTLTITDCQDTGKVTSACTRSEGGLIYISNNGQAAPCLNLYAGTLESTGSVNKFGGLIVMGNGQTQDVTVNIYGGTLTGGSAGLNGGAIYMNTRTSHTQTLNIYGGTITGCEVTGDGGMGGAIGFNMESNAAATGIINIYGGSITGNTADLGGDIYAYTVPNLSGDVVIGDLYLLSGQTLDVSSLTSGASIGISMEAAGVFAENVETDLSGLFSSTDESLTVKYDEAAQTLLLEELPHQNHCVCGGHGAGAAEHTCDETVEWTEWTSTNSLPTTSGNYYLVDDVKLSSRTNIGTKNADANVAICLNGKTITSPSNNGAFSVHGTLTITDCRNTGKVTSACTNRAEGGLIYISNNGQAAPCLNLYAGTLESTGSVTTQGGLIVMGNGGTKDVTVNIYGGTLTGGSAGKIGGAIYMNTRTTHTQTLNIYGGTITGCEVTGDGGIGGAIGFNTGTNAAATGIINIYGGSITGNTADLGGDIYAYTVPNLSGDVVIGDLYLLSGQTLDVSSLTDGASIGISMEVPGVFAENVTSDPGCFTAQGGYEILYSQEDQTLSLWMDPDAHKHCVCGGQAEGVGDHEACTELVGWIPLTASSFTANGSNLKLEDGNYYLEADLTLTKSVDILTGQNVTICLNGHTITNSARCFRVNGTLNITDCQEEAGKIVGTSRLAPVFYGYNGGHVNLYAGQLKAGNTDSTTTYWGGVAALSKDTGNTSAEGPSSFTMYGGSLVGTSVVKDSSGGNGKGGTLWVMTTCTFTMYDGSLTGGSAEATGGNLHAEGSAIVNLLGGSITGGTAPKGADVCVNSTNVKLTLGGNMVIGELYIPAGYQITDLSGLTDGASIGITMGTAGVFAENVTTYIDGTFFSKMTGYVVKYLESQLSLAAE